ncbi:LCP family protein [Romboutsia lituseburensis]|uniref:Cell envelope-related function transcriptional attenuator common domain-containing protein n=1 Tax=Romboutsia lituseburensis DSM 797 TaxID=1121325 RepID=A0A1G9KJS5_9FIRM|nr:LCP family protein [Romboutsia lituseburensis]CEH34938.1 Cell envelope-related transcriptional attenuator [Romboutsia lituseburensis]SDL49981.1 cell envelope-related function transcriptional attenuator common domain-containing protein [Romboutsia lituseburensis DSM 797]
MKKLNNKIIIAILLFLLILVGLLGFIIYKSQNEENPTKNIPNIENELKNEKHIDIALFGIDKRNENEKSRSDSIIIASIDLEKKTINLVSLLRDTLVEIDGHGQDKLNHAYAYGGSKLSLETINSNFDLDIDKYVSVDFYSLAKVIDIVGGVDIELKDYEIEQINANLVEINKIENLKKGTDYITQNGIKTLNGRQAVAYSRIRKKGNGDYERTQRQRNVLKSILEKYEKQPSDKKFEINMEIIGQISTNIPVSYIKELGLKIFSDKEFEVNQYMIPYEGSFETITYKNMWCIKPNMKENIIKLKEYIK